MPYQQKYPLTYKRKYIRIKTNKNNIIISIIGVLGLRIYIYFTNVHTKLIERMIKASRAFIIFKKNKLAYL